MRQAEINTEDIFLFEGQPLRFLGGKADRIRITEIRAGSLTGAVTRHHVRKLTDVYEEMRNKGGDGSPVLADSEAVSMKYDGYPALVGPEDATDEQLAGMRRSVLADYLGEQGAEIRSGAVRLIAVSPHLMRDITGGYALYRAAWLQSAERAAVRAQRHLEWLDRVGRASKRSGEILEFFAKVGVTGTTRESPEPVVTFVGEDLAELVELLTSRLLPREGLLGSLSLGDLEHAVRGGAELLVGDVDEGAVLSEEAHEVLTRANVWIKNEQYGQEMSERLDLSTVPRAIASLGTERPEGWEVDVRMRWTALLKVDGRAGAWAAIAEALKVQYEVSQAEAMASAHKIIGDARADR